MSAETSSLWFAEAALPAWSPLERSARCEVLVIGAGLSGLAVAGALAARGLDVLVLDEHGPGAGASSRNAGFVLVTHVWEYPELRAQLGAEGARTLLAMARRTHVRIAELLAGSGAHRACGSLMLPMAGDAAEAQALAHAAEVLRSDGVETKAVAAPATLAGFGAGLVVEEDGEVHPGALLARLAQEVPRGQLGRVTALDLDARRAQVGAAQVDFDHVVVATNAHTRTLVPELDAILTPHRAQVLVTAPLPPVLDRPCYANYGYDYFRQRPDGAIVLGGRRHLHRDAEATERAETTAALQADLEAFLGAHVPSARGVAIAHRWAGIMGLTPDGAPLVGALPRAPRAASLLAGWNGHGVGLAIAGAEQLAERLATGRGGPSAALDPARFPTILRAR